MCDDTASHLVPAELLLLLVVQAETKRKRKGTESCKERGRSPGIVCVCARYGESVSGQDGEEEGEGRRRKSFVSE